MIPLFVSSFDFGPRQKSNASPYNLPPVLIAKKNFHGNGAQFSANIRIRSSVWDFLRCAVKQVQTWFPLSCRIEETTRPAGLFAMMAPCSANTLSDFCNEPSPEERGGRMLMQTYAMYAVLRKASKPISNQQIAEKHTPCALAFVWQAGHGFSFGHAGFSCIGTICETPCQHEIKTDFPEADWPGMRAACS
jgi:hypothetical protein